MPNKISKPSKSKKTSKKPESRFTFWQTLRQQSWPARLRNWRFYTLIIVGLFILWIIVVITIGLWYQNKHKDDPVELGVSFSADQAQNLGVNWQGNFKWLLQDVGVKHFRLMSYWDNLEPSPGQYNFKDLDWQFAQAKNYNADISLAIGIRQPRWPECHQPDWVKKLPEKQQDEQLYKFLAAVVSHYKDQPALKDYQLENETANHSFGTCDTASTKFNRTRLTKELNVVKSIDKNHPVDINVSNQSGISIGKPVADEVGFSIYQTAWVNMLGPIHFYWSFGYTPPLWHSYRAGVIELLHGSPTFVHELQTEPWGPTDTKYLSIAEQNKSMTPKKIVSNVHFAQNTGMHRMYLWGGEWWYWRLTKFRDDSLAKTATQLYRQSNATGKINYDNLVIPSTPAQ